ncbi:hypothetical protein PR048_001263 [Dryococelus australis]|uniref:Uncharacterized protein n=1 Tax=Dryococelus australis TaxID=614101 RepID=A0ABQ9IGW7_9NEOP|nr:hypothetical protein PR048_001263 [Dryococelus australis]
MQTASTLSGVIWVRSGEIWAALNSEFLRADEGETRYGAAPEFKDGGNRRSPRKTANQRHRPATIPTCGNPGANIPGIEPCSPLWEASSPNTLTTAAPIRKTRIRAVLAEIRGEKQQRKSPPPASERCLLSSEHQTKKTSEDVCCYVAPSGRELEHPWVLSLQHEDDTFLPNVE